jgi:hypothetical protein
MERMRNGFVGVLVVLFSMLSLATLAGCPKDETGSAAEVKVKPDASTANVIRVETTIPWGKKVPCAKILDPAAVAAALGEAEVTINDTTESGEKEATSICSVKKTGKVLTAKEQEKLGSKEGFKIGVQPGDEICQLRAYCSYNYDIADSKKKAEAMGQTCSTDIGDLTCIQEVQAGADYRYIVTVLDPDSKCQYKVSPTTITTKEPMLACAKAFVEQISKEKLQAP